MEDRRQKYMSSLQPETMSSPDDTSNQKLDLHFDITELDLLCAYVVSDNRSITRTGINNIKKIIDILDLSKYKDDIQSMTRINFIKKGISARIDKNLQNRFLIIKDILGGMGSGMMDIRELSNVEIDWVNTNTTRILQTNYLRSEADNVIQLFTDIKTMDPAKSETTEIAIQKVLHKLNNHMRQVKVNTADSVTFSLRPDICKDVLRQTYRQVTSPNNVLTFGTQAFNLIFGGGVQATRIYVLLGLPGERKSSTLLDMAIQIKENNKGYVCADPTKRPCVVLFSMENSVFETVERLYSMLTLRQLKDELNEDAALNIFAEKGLHLSDDDPIDLFILYRPNFSEDTSYMYDIIDNLSDEGYEVICMLQDYAMRIKSADDSANKELRIQLGAVINEFKTLATLKNIPVITASQLNRIATANIDNARIRNKSDLVRLLGRSNVAESNMIINNSDWIGLIAPEMSFDKQQTYLGIQLVKSRYYIPNRLDCVFIPYIENSLKLVEDIYLPKPLHRTSMIDEDVLAAQLNGNGPSGNNTVFGVNGVRTFTEVDDNTFEINEDSVFQNASGFAARDLSLPYAPMNHPTQQLYHTVKRQLYRVVN